MRAALVLLLLAPLAPEAQTLSFDLGIAVIGDQGDGLGYVEISASGARPIGQVAYVSARGSLANALFDVGGDCFECGDLAESMRTLSVIAGVHRDWGDAAVRAGAGPTLSQIVQTFGEDQVRIGVSAEVGLNIYTLQFLGFGLSVHGTATSSYSWAGARGGVRVRL